MIYRIVNLAEVEQGIREAAEERALRGILVSMLSAHGSNVAREVVERDAEIAPNPNRSPSPPHPLRHGMFARYRPAVRNPVKWQLLPPFERDRLSLLATSHLARALSAERGRMLDNFIEGRAEALTCHTCGENSAAVVHQLFSETDHEFVCPHGVACAVATDCIMDHPDLPV